MILSETEGIGSAIPSVSMKKDYSANRKKIEKLIESPGLQQWKPRTNDAKYDDAEKENRIVSDAIKNA